MIKNVLGIYRQIDDKIYHFFVPHNGSWQEAISFAEYALKYCSDQLKATEEAEKAKAATTQQPQLEKNGNQQ